MRLILSLFGILMVTNAYGQGSFTSKVIIKPEDSHYVYKYEDRELRQIINLSIVGVNKIAFTIETFNKIKNCKAQFADTATIYHVEGADDVYEYQDDYESDPYPVVKFIYKEKFFLSFNIGFPDKKRISVEEADGSLNYHHNDCPFDIGKTLTLINNKL